MYKIYNKFSDISELKDDWNNIAFNMGNPMLNFEWFSFAFNAFRSDDKLYIYCVIENNKLTAIAPLYQKKNDGTHGKLFIIGSEDLYEPTSFLYSSTESLKKLIGHLTTSKFSMELNRLPEDLVCKLMAYKNKISLSHALLTEGSQYLTNLQSANTFEGTLSPKRRSDLRRSFRKLAEIGEYHFEISQPSLEEVNELLNIAFVVENSGWKTTKNSSIISTKEMMHFITDIFKHYTGGVSTVGLLYSQNIAIACNLSFIYAKKLWIIKIGYNDKFKHCSPGNVLTHEMIRYCCDTGVQNVEFLGSYEEWINLWRPKQRKYMTFLFYPVSYSGFKAIITDFIALLKAKISRTLRT